MAKRFLLFNILIVFSLVRLGIGIVLHVRKRLSGAAAAAGGAHSLCGF